MTATNNAHDDSFSKLVDSFSHLTLNPSTLSSLHSMKSVVSLHLCYINFRDVEFDFSLTLERFPALEALYLEELTLPCKLSQTFHPPQQLTILKLDSITWDNSCCQEAGTAVASFLRQLIGQSGLEVLQLVRIEDMGVEVLPIVSAISTLKDLNIQLPIFTHNNEYLVIFITILGTSRLEELTLINVFSLSSEVLVALSNLPLLRKLYVTFDQALRLDTAVYAHKGGLQHLFLNAPNLVDVKIEALVVQDDANERRVFDQIVRVAEQQVPGSNIFYTGFADWLLEIAILDGNAMFNVHAKRVER
ncbi:hypothetical protein BJV82DRAFT_583613 [Fennellomyces sp. T-0311]|nr:hypothetical protein BJV82DRAFT_583613 [Fennellomyces sp. T-0311]